MYNRGELMILPPGVSKGLGLVRALDSLGLSPHNTIGVGDAENDHSLLGICETGVAVGNAVNGRPEQGGQIVCRRCRRRAVDRTWLLRVPHWIIVDEAHHALGLPGELLTTLDEGDKGYCLVTYQPQVLGERLKSASDVLLVLPGGKRMVGPDPLAEVDRLSGLEVSERLKSAEAGQAALVGLTNGHDIRLITLAARRTERVRHWHKYLQARLPPGLRFVFRKAGEPGGTTASNVEEFRELLRASAPEVVAHHAGRSDFSRWIAEALQDERLAQTVRPMERQYIASNRTQRDVDILRRDVVAAVLQRYAQ